jgi:hypothetical protein
MSRTTETELGLIVEIETGADVTPFIEAANELVTEFCSDSDYSADRLTRIETWLAAHFYAMRYPLAASEKVDVISVNYQYKIGFMFHQTRYGQMALLLDTAGNLAALSKRIEEGDASEIVLEWLGGDASET